MSVVDEVGGRGRGSGGVGAVLLVYKFDEGDADATGDETYISCCLVKAGVDGIGCC